MRRTESALGGSSWELRVSRFTSVLKTGWIALHTSQNSENISPPTNLDIIRQRNGCAEEYICLSYNVSCEFQTSEGIIHSFLPPSTPSSKNYVGGNKNMLYSGRIMKFFPNWPKLPQSQLAQLRSLREKGELKEIHSQVTFVALGQNRTRGEKFGSANFA